MNLSIFQTQRISDNTRARMLAGGIISGSMLGYTFATNLRRDGYRILADVADLNIPFQDSAVHVQEFSQSVSGHGGECHAGDDRCHRFHSRAGHKNAVLQSLVQWLRLAQTEELADDRIVRKLEKEWAL